MLTSPALPGQPRAGGRVARGPQLAAALAARITARDRWILRMLLEHRTLTTGQLTDLAFGTTRACTARMSILYQLRAVDRFRPLAIAGSTPLHFVLDEAGAAILAAEEATTPAGLGWRRDRAMAIALSPRLAHDTGASGVFTALAATARASGGRQALEVWWSERRCAAAWDHARPDGYGRWRDQPPGGQADVADFFLEYDTGTEALGRVIAKLPGYAALAARTGIPTPVLFWVPTMHREAALRARLAGPPLHGTHRAASAAQVPGVPIATAVDGISPGGPAGAAWLPVGGPGPRLRLAQLGQPGTTAPAAAEPGDLPAAPAGGLPWHPPSPVPPDWRDLPRQLPQGRR